MIKTLLVVEPNERPSVDDVLKMPSIVSRMSMLPPQDLPESAMGEDKAGLDLVGTIHVRRGVALVLGPPRRSHCRST